jgi:hypothetical protein
VRQMARQAAGRHADVYPAVESAIGPRAMIT